MTMIRSGKQTNVIAVITKNTPESNPKHSIQILALDLSHPTTPEVTPPNGTPAKESHPTITGSHPKQVGPPWYTSFIYPWNMASWTREFWVYLWEVWWIVAKMECTFYVNPNGTLANLHLWFVPTLDTSKLLFLWGVLSRHPKRAIKRETNPTGTAPTGSPNVTSSIKLVDVKNLPVSAHIW